MREQSFEERVPDSLKLEKFRDFQEDITEVEPEKDVNQPVPAEGQYTTKKKFKNRGTLKNLSGNEQKSVKKGAGKEMRGVSLCSCYYVFQVVEAHLNAMQTL